MQVIALLGGIGFLIWGVLLIAVPSIGWQARLRRNARHGVSSLAAPTKDTRAADVWTGLFLIGFSTIIIITTIRMLAAG